MKREELIKSVLIISVVAALVTSAEVNIGNHDLYQVLMALLMVLLVMPTFFADSLDELIFWVFLCAVALARFLWVVVPWSYV
jgi:hypothetical protein